MELKPPAPLGESETKKETIVNQPSQVEQYVEKTSEFKLPSIHFPKINIPWLKLPQINLPPGKKRKILEISLIAVPLVLLIILFILIYSFIQSEPYRMARTFLQEIETRNITAAYDMTTDAYKASVSLKEFKTIADTLNSVDISHPKLKDRSRTKIAGMGEYAYVKYKVSGYYVDITVFNDDIDWGIHSVDINLIDQ